MENYEIHVTHTGNMRGRIRFRSTIENKIQEIKKELDELGINYRERTEKYYVVNIQSKSEIWKFLDKMNWKANSKRKQNVVDGIRQYKNSPLG